MRFSTNDIVLNLKNINPALKILLFTNALILMCNFMLGPIYALFVVEIGGDLMDAGLTASVYGLAAALTSLVSGIYADKIKENEYIIILGYLIMGIAFILFFFVDNIWFLFVVQALIGIGEAVYLPAFDAIYSKHLSKGNTGKEWSYWEVMKYFIYIIGAALGAYLVTLFGFGAVFILMAGLCFFSAIFIFFQPRKAL